ERGLPMVWNVCDDWPSYAPVLDAWSRMWTTRPRLAAVARRVLRLPTAVPDLGARAHACWVSRSTRDRARDLSAWTFPVSGVVYGAVDLDVFPRRPSTPPWRGRLLYAGRLDRRKGIDTVVRALPLLPTATLEVRATDDGGRRREVEAL